MCLLREIFQEQGVHRALEADVQVRDIALGQRHGVHAREGQALEQSRGVFLAAAEAVLDDPRSRWSGTQHCGCAGRDQRACKSPSTTRAAPIHCAICWASRGRSRVLFTAFGTNRQEPAWSVAA